ncbi:hypothetical protein [Variovorax sp. 38R]|uniref:hypothetical protein n=1 Tax=Variovorax sp. 38R TaxID=2774875 RepID=UPI0017839636|nr:hypothetical protein [Variovorax sp. 38R]QOF76183.1 hypothetical protein IG196_17485 [Variovorax sp. 38R]
MSQTDFFPASTTILRMPTWLGRDVAQDHPLPHALGDYKITPGMGAERWTVTFLKANEVVYRGIGPVEIIHARARARGESDARSRGITSRYAGRPRMRRVRAIKRR